MDRRRFMAAASAGVVGASAAGLAAPALAQTAPVLRWRCASSFPSVLDTAFGGAVALSRLVREASDGGFEIEVLPAGTIAPAGDETTAAVISGSVEMCHTSSGYSAARNPVYALGAAVPFGLNARGMQAWLGRGEGLALLNRFFHEEGLHYLPGGNTGAQMGGWFRQEIRTVADFGGLKIGLSGLAGQVVSRLGAVPGDIAVGDVRAALESGRVDAAAWSGPHEDERLGFVAAAPYYHYPGWWEGGLQLAFFINKAAFDALPPAYRSLLGTAARAVTLDMLGEYDFQNPPALKRLVAAGAQIRPFPQPVLNACFDAANAVYAEINVANPAFRTIFASIEAFRNEAFLYAQVPEYTYDTFMMIKQREGALVPRAQDSSAPALRGPLAPG